MAMTWSLALCRADRTGETVSDDPASPGASGPNTSMDVHADPDEALVARVARGDRRAFAAIVRRHAGRLRALAVRFSGDPSEADDIVQEAFWAVWRNAASWQPDGPPFSAWLTRIAINRAIDVNRRRRVRRFFGLEEATDPPDQSPSAETAAVTRSELAAVAADIHQLPARQRAAILLAADGDRSNSAIATILGVSEGAVEQLLVRARRTLRTRLAEREATEGKRR